MQQAEKKVMEAELAYKTADIAFLTKRQKLHDTLAYYQEPSVVARLKLRMERMHNGVQGLKNIWQKAQAALVEARLEAVRDEAANEIAQLHTQLDTALELAHHSQDNAAKWQLLHSNLLVAQAEERAKVHREQAREAREDADAAKEAFLAERKRELWLHGVL